MVPALALGAEPPEMGVMEQPPRSHKQSLLDLPLLLRAYSFLGAIEAVVSMLGFAIIWWSHGYTLTDLQQFSPALLSHTADPHITSVYRQATTLTLAAIVACQVGNLFACRSERWSVLRLSWVNNPLLGWGITTELLTLLLFIYFPPLSRVFSTAPLDLWQWLLLLVCPPLLLGLEEIRKRIRSYQ
jgi:Ca2+-transporting ATPase